MISRLHFNETIEKKLGFARAVTIGDLTFVSGTVSIDNTGHVVGANDMAIQMEVAYKNLSEILEKLGRTFDDVVKETVYVTNIGEFIKASAVRRKFYNDDVPASTGVEVSRLALPELMIEIEIVVAV